MSSGAAPRRPRGASSGKLGTRAVVRPIEPGEASMCESCGERVKFRARHKDKQVIANRYVRGKWNRVEHYHHDCYVDAGEPCGVAS